MRTLEDWLEELTSMCNGTEYEAIRNGGHQGNEGVVIVPRGSVTPQRILIVPRKTKGASIAIEMDVYSIVKGIPSLGEPARIKSNRPHYLDLTDETIIQVCKRFLGKV